LATRGIRPASVERQLAVAVLVRFLEALLDLGHAPVGVALLGEGRAVEQSPRPRR